MPTHFPELDTLCHQLMMNRLDIARGTGTTAMTFRGIPRTTAWAMGQQSFTILLEPGTYIALLHGQTEGDHGSYRMEVQCGNCTQNGCPAQHNGCPVPTTALPTGTVSRYFRDFIKMYRSEMTEAPSAAPTQAPTNAPSNPPTFAPSASPSTQPTEAPSTAPTRPQSLPQCRRRMCS